MAALLLWSGAAAGYDVVLNAQGEWLDAYLIDGSAAPARVVFIDPDPPRPDDPTSPPARVGRHVNGKVCFFPRGSRRWGQFVMADDTYREACLDRATPQARCSVTNPRDPDFVGTAPDGWSIFRRTGKWTGLQIHVDVDVPGSEPQGTIDPQGCAFDDAENLWGTDVGHGGFGNPDGSLVVFFPGRRHRYDSHCFVDKALASPGMLVRDPLGNLWIPEPAAGRLTRFSPPFPTSAADCANPARLVTTPPTKTTFALAQAATPVGIVRLAQNGHFFVTSAVLPAIVNEYDGALQFVRNLVPSGVPRNPLGIDVGADGTVYYSELNLDPVTFRTRCGSMSRVRFDAAGAPLAPETLGTNLRFPDGVTVVDSRRLKIDLTRLPPSPQLTPDRCGGE